MIPWTKEAIAEARRRAAENIARGSWRPAAVEAESPPRWPEPGTEYEPPSPVPEPPPGKDEGPPRGRPL